MRFRTDSATEESLTVLGHVKGSFYIVQYPVRWTARSALHFFFHVIH